MTWERVPHWLVTVLSKGAGEIEDVSRYSSPFVGSDEFAAEKQSRWHKLHTRWGPDTSSKLTASSGTFRDPGHILAGSACGSLAAVSNFFQINECWLDLHGEAR